MSRPRYVAVVGPDAPAATEADCEHALAVGGLLAERGCVVVCGGLGGVMGAAAEGAAERGGTTVGLLPGTDRDVANPYLTIAIPTGLGQSRNVLVVRAADGVIAVGGSWGTLSELAMARRSGLPVVSIGGWSVHDVAGAPLDLVTANSAAEAVDLLLDTIVSIGR
jgi:uncharacterized protein (TIGR00725 family)